METKTKKGEVMCGYSQQGIHNGRVGAVLTEVVNQDTNTVSSLGGPELLKCARQLDDVCEVAECRSSELAQS